MSVDWSVLDEDVQSVCDKAASKARSKANVILDIDDLKQEAYILCATRPDIVRGYVERDELGLLYNDIYRDLLNLLDTEVQRRNRSTSFEKLIEDERAREAKQGDATD